MVILFLCCLLPASITLHVEVDPCLFELLSLTLDFLLGGDIFSQSFMLYFSKRPLLFGSDQKHGFELQALCCDIMDIISITHLAITFEITEECDHVPAFSVMHWQVANSVSPVDF